LHPLEWQLASLHGQSETPNHVRGDGSFPPKRSLGADDGCAANHSSQRALLCLRLLTEAQEAEIKAKIGH
jgi:hypothetical protein